ncbi:hypothetical protein HanHA89_Chr09g0339101 [Helianthus annuus]|nr:hypothetical protein HanHA89_Chr09g0339101 [Helianthus annuus]
MSEHECSIIEIPDDKIVDWIIGSLTDVDANPTPQQSSAAKIPRLSRSMVSEKLDYDKYFVPQAVSIGPYYFGQPKLQMMQKRKPFYTMRLLSGNKETLRSLYNKLAEPDMLKDLRSFYEENSTSKYCDKRGFLSTLFYREQRRALLCSSRFVFVAKPNSFQTSKGGDEFGEHMCDLYRICWFISDYQPAVFKSEADRLAKSLESELIDNEPNHLLHLFHRARAPTYRFYKGPMNALKEYYNNNSKTISFPTANQLLDVWIRFQPSETISLKDYDFSKYWCGFSDVVRLPPISLSATFKPKLLNLIAYETCSDKEAWVTSYVCLLHSLIRNHEDVKVLRKSGVIRSQLGTDNEVLDFFNEIATDLVPRNSTYTDLKDKIQGHYEDWSNTSIFELRHEYRKSPWKYISLLGAFLALFLTAVQTYFTVWSRS